MRRHLFTVASAVSLLLCVATISLWGIAQRFHHFHVTTRWTDEPRQLTLVAEAYGWNDYGILQSGSYHVWFHTPYDDNTPPETLDETRMRLRGEFGPPNTVKSGWQMQYPDDWRWPQRGAFGMPLRGADSSQVWITYPQAITWLLVLPVFWIIAFTRTRLRAMRHSRIGCCPTCGYNLTGNTSGVCPECGTPVSQGAR